MRHPACSAKQTPSVTLSVIALTRAHFRLATCNCRCARAAPDLFGVVLGAAALLIMRRGRAGNIPPLKIVVVLILFIVIMGVDGVNSNDSDPAPAISLSTTKLVTAGHGR